MEDKRPVNSAHTGNNSSDNHLCKRKRTNLEYSSNWHDNDTNGKCLFPAKAFALSWWTLVKFIQPGDTNIPKRKVEMAPKKLGGVSFLVTWGRFLMMIQTILCRTMTQLFPGGSGSGCPWCWGNLEWRWYHRRHLGHNLHRENHSDKSKTEDTMKQQAHQRASLLWYKQQSSRCWAEFQSCRNKASF